MSTKRASGDGEVELTRARGRFIALAAIVLVAALFSTGALSPTRAGADTTGVTSYFYLAIGASESLGFQPTSVSPRGERTDGGYADDLVAYEAARGLSLDLTQVGCPGETTTTMLTGEDHCYGGVDTQLAAAMSFLSDHYGEPGLVTIDLGFNNVRLCLRDQTDDPDCVRQQLETVRTDLPLIIQSLKSVAGPGVTFVGLGHYDPYLADELRGATDASFAAHSERAMNRLNGVLRFVYSSEDLPMADVDNYFDGHDDSPTTLAGVGVVANNVAHICELTWMCDPPPYGPDFHPNDAGYALIAAAIEAVLPAPY